MKMAYCDELPDEKYIVNIVSTEAAVAQDLIRVVTLPSKREVAIFILKEMEIDEIYREDLKKYLRSFGYYYNILSMDGVQKVEVEF